MQGACTQAIKNQKLRYTQLWSQVQFDLEIDSKV